ncbi:Der GTPase-activating protein YihI [Otariodibacter sp.]|uniref:Der GTPase-activating protein YihI n=1 Tax=Otariodibacter sp. TaxID=3030919 RepID=UPI00261212B0|nr:Der GTPase-activating protein YihI [Otariodibacter sp.]
MSRTKKTRRITDVMPIRKADKSLEIVHPTTKKRKPTRYELDLQSREEKKKKKHKGLPSGSRFNDGSEQKKGMGKEIKDPRIGSRKKVPLMVEFVNKPEKGKVIPKVDIIPKKAPLLPEIELEQLENNECLNQLLDDLETGKRLSANDQKFVDECLDRVHQLMEELGIQDEEESEEDLLRQFETLDINKFRE